jgi:hypothetical protein
MTNSKKDFISYRTFKTPILVKTANNYSVKAYGEGKIQILMNVNGKKITWTLSNVLYIPHLSIVTEK